MKTFIGLFLISVVTFADAGVDFAGNFAAVTSSGVPCDIVFQHKNYNTKHFATGPTKLTSVLYFTASGAPGFFDHLSFVGQLGGSGDFLSKKTVRVNGHDFEMVAEGIVDKNVVVAGISVKAYQAGKVGLVCTASGEYTGFSTLAN